MTTQRAGGLPRVLAIAWGLHEPPQRGPARGLDHERIVRAAIEIADRDGLAAVTMKRVAESLGFTTMSLYRYVATKDELLLLMQGSETAAAPFRPGDGDWRSGLRQWADHVRGLYRSHPWLLEVPPSELAVMMPASVALVDSGLGVMASLRLTDQERMAVILSLSTYAASFVGLERDLAAAGQLEFGEEAFRQLGSAITSERFPHLAPLLTGGGYVGAPAADDEPGVEVEFVFGLERLLDGLERLHDERAGEPDGEHDEID
jgi:AcrR family transcriptional regulator